MHIALTQAQLGIWMGHQHATDSSIYNCADVTSLTGELEREKFESALLDTLGRTQALCQKFVEVNGEPRGVASSLRSGVYEYSDLSAFSSPRAEAELRMHAELKSVLDIEDGQLCKHRLYRLSEREFLWFHLAHHIALDGYAFQLLSRAVAQHYATGKRGREFGALSSIQQEDERYEASEERRQDEVFWCQGPGWQSEAVRLGGYRLPGVALQTVATRPRRCRMDVDHELYRGLKQQAQAQGMSWVNLLMALVVGFIAKHSNRTQLSVGLPVMLRLGTAGLNVPNMAMNINRLPLAVPLDATPAQTAVHIEQRLALQRAHQRFRYEGLRGSRRGKPSFGPVLNVMPFGSSARFGDCQASASSLSAGPVEDLSIAVYPQGNGLRCDIDLHPELYSELGSRALVQDLQHWFENGVAHCQQPWGQQPWSERPWQAAENPSGVCAITAIEKRANRAPEALALVCEARSWTYRQLLQDVRQFAQWLTDEGVEPGQLVAFDMPRSPELIPYVLGVLYCGCGYLVVSSDQPLKRRAQMLKQARARLVLNSLPALPSQGAPRVVRARPEDPAYVVFTSDLPGSPRA